MVACYTVYSGDLSLDNFLCKNSSKNLRYYRLFFRVRSGSDGPDGPDAPGPDRTRPSGFELKSGPAHPYQKVLLLSNPSLRTYRKIADLLLCSVDHRILYLEEGMITFFFNIQ